MTTGSPAASTTRTITVPRSARYVLLGTPSERTRELWIACHGYGQLAEYFSRHLAALDDGTRAIVVPEGLSRFYLESPQRRAAGGSQRVGASWMTREAREEEIDDHVRFLSLVLAEVRGELPSGVVPSLHVLGFSQGVATAARWIDRSGEAVDRFVAWAGAIPGDVPLGEGAPLRRVRLTCVVGDADEFISAAMFAEHRERLETHGLAPRVLGFSGGHRLDREALRVAVAT